MIQKSGTNIFKNPLFYLVLAFLFFNAGIIPVILNKFYTFSMFAPNDFCERAQAIYNTCRGILFRTSILEWLKDVDFSIFGDHLFLLTFIFIPLCYIFRQPEYLLIFQTIIFSASVFPLYLIARKRLGSKWLSLFISIGFLFYPLTIKLCFYDFRFEYFAVFFLFWAFYYLQKDSIKGCVLFLILACLCKENVFVISAFFGIYIFLFKNSIKRNKVIGVLIFLASFLVLIAYLKLFGPIFSRDNYYQPIHHYEQLNKIFSDKGVYLSRMFAWPKVAFFASLFKILLFVPLFSWEALLILPGLLQNILADTFNESLLFVTVNLWHSAVLLPFIFIGLVFGFANIAVPLKKGKWTAYILVFISLFGFGVEEFYKSAYMPFKQNKLWNLKKADKYKTLLKIKKLLPKDKSIIVHLPLLSSFSDFGKVYFYLLNKNSIKKENTLVDYIIYSEDVTYSQKSGLNDDRDLIKEYMASGSYVKLLEKDGFVVMKRPDA